jgi:hypothetical protein
MLYDAALAFCGKWSLGRVIYQYLEEKLSKEGKTLGKIREHLSTPENAGAARGILQSMLMGNRIE